MKGAILHAELGDHLTIREKVIYLLSLILIQCVGMKTTVDAVCYLLRSPSHRLPSSFPTSRKGQQTAPLEFIMKKLKTEVEYPRLPEHPTGGGSLPYETEFPPLHKKTTRNFTVQSCRSII